MKEQMGAIIDLDGTLYDLQGGDGTFGQSDFYAALKTGMVDYLGRRLNISAEHTASEYDRLKLAYAGAVSVGVEEEHALSREEWFAATWNLEPSQYVVAKGDGLAAALEPLQGRSLILTSGPAVWARPALHHLGLGEFFKDDIITGEYEPRKPMPEVFLKAASLLMRPPENIVSIGDQNHTDILPARNLGMLTVRIGSTIDDAHLLAPDAERAVELIVAIEAGERIDPRRNA